MGAGGAIAQGGIAGLQLLEAKNQADSIKRQSQFEANQLEFNSQLLEFTKRDIAKQAETDKELREKQLNQMLGAQKVSFAGQGVDLDSEVVQLFERDERNLALEEVQAIKNNAWKQSMGIEIQQSDLRNQAVFTRLAGKDKARQAISSGILSAASTGISAASKFRRG